MQIPSLRCTCWLLSFPPVSSTLWPVGRKEVEGGLYSNFPPNPRGRGFFNTEKEAGKYGDPGIYNPFPSPLSVLLRQRKKGRNWKPITTAREKPRQVWGGEGKKKAVILSCLGGQKIFWFLVVFVVTVVVVVVSELKNAPWISFW